MVKLLRMKMMLLLLWMVGAGTSAWAEEVTFTFNTDDGIKALGISKPDASMGTSLSSTADYVLGDVTMNITHGGTDTRVFNSNGTLDLRVYKNGGSLTFTAQDNITKIVLAGKTVKNFTAATGSFSSGTWTGSATSVTLTASGTNNINTITVTYTATTVSDPVDPTIVVKNAEVTYGSTFTVDDELIVGGPITVTSSNENVATVSGLVITPVAVGTTTITVSTAANSAYNAGSATFTLTVTAPAGQTTAPTASNIFKESFSESTGSLESFSGNDGNGTFKSDVSGWSTQASYGANGSAKFGSSKNKGSATTPSINVVSGSTYNLTFKAAPWASETSTMNITVSGGTISGISSGNMTTAAWNDYSTTITATSATLTITFTASNNRFFLDDVVVASAAGAAITAKLNDKGYATFCSEYPLDFTDAEANGYSAWQITNIDNDNQITFSQITGSVKGGTGIFLKGEADATVTLTSADSSNELTNNLLEGTLAPTYVETGKYYGLSGNSFVKVNAGTVPAGKALIDADWITESANGARFTFVFTESTGIETVKTTMGQGKVFDLQGRRVYTPGKGMYIVDGKKMIMK